MKKTKRLLAIVLAMVMTLSGLTINAFAADESVSLGNYYDVDEYGNVTGKGTTDPEKTVTDTESDAYVNMSKTAAATGNDNEFEITLNVETMQDMEEVETTESASVVLVFDVSDIMDRTIDDKFPGDSEWKLEDTMWTALKKVAIEFITEFLAANPNNQISIVVYGGSSYSVSNRKVNSDYIVYKTICDWTCDANEAIGSFDIYDTVSEETKLAIGSSSSLSLRNEVFGDSAARYGGSTNSQAGFVGAIIS